ncbi:MAG: DNA topoisomerase III [uncultured Thermoleophilia bacterium]|uniref:DNA topoisomerase n=1 Tax=uncultured Thermoleophilia bacterium TaxID=1497501 RepID=A0A6J4TQQ8_9ACTN|nr:MAG: DNA topoisomerase III [uncultured Thermoleophilia bacterium]
MPKTLIITEKPSVARDVTAALPEAFRKKGDFYESEHWVVGSAVGHLVEQVDPDEYDTRYKKWRFEDLPILPEEFRYEARDDRSQKQLASLHAAIRRPDVEALVNACDAGREGELIFKLITQTSGTTKPVRRAWFSSMTQRAIREAVERLRDDGELRPLEDAARSRSEADWLVGMNATRAATTKAGSLRSIVSLGRVQTPTLALIARRDMEIAAFVPEDYWQVRAAFATAAEERYTGVWQRGSQNRIPNAQEAERIAAVAGGVEATVVSVERKPLEEQAPMLYDLTTLQREANSRFGFTAKRTLAAAQGCYDRHKVLTYPRTNSRFLSSDLIPTLRSVAGYVGGAAPEYAKPAAYVQGLDSLPLGRVVDDAKVGDHHAIVPTDERPDLSALSADERRIYDMVARRFLAVFHPPARFEQTVVWTEAGGERFRSRGKVLIDAGWRAAYGEVAESDKERKADDDEGAEQDLPRLEDGQRVRCTAAEVQAKQTKPPARFSESSLLRAMETAGKLVDDDLAAEAMKESGLGTPATRAATIERLIDAGYIEREGRQLKATDKGLAVIRMLGDHDLTQPALTGSWEQRLARIEAGEESREAFMRDIARFTETTVAWFADKDRSAMRVERRVIGPCPNCDGEILERPKSYSCSSWRSKKEPGCGYTIWKQVGARTITPEEAEQLVRDKVDPATLAAERTVVGPCPTPGCGGEIVERAKSYGCTSWKSRTETGCGYVIWKRAGGKDVTFEDAQAMVAEGRTNAGPATSAEPVGPCPTPGCGGQIVERGKSYGCTSWKSKKQTGCGFVIWKRQRGLGRDIERDEAARLVAAGLSAPPKDAEPAVVAVAPAGDAAA